MLEPRRTRSIWIGILFLGIALIVAVATMVIVLTDQSLPRLGDVTGDDGGGSGQIAAQVDATATAEAMPTPTPAPARIPEDLQLSATAAFVIHTGSDAVLFDRAADEPLQPASTIKIVTALTVLKHASPEEVIVIVQEDVVDPVAESSMGLQAGDHVTIHDLLVGLMLPSGNDAANALARTIGERIPDNDQQGLTPGERFVEEMNVVAREIGMESSVLAHAAGHDREGQAVTARDLAIAAEALLERPSLAPIVAMKSAEIRVGGERARVITVENTNELLAHDSVHGVKTGTTSEANQCLVVAQREGDETIIAVILGSQDRYGDARALLNLPDPPEPEPEDEAEADPEG